jgi:CheY-like chemotaxis protein
MRLKATRPLVLVADDEPEHAEIVSMLLTRRGYDVRVVYSAAEVIEQAVSQPPAVVLLDAYMPGTDGVVAAHRLRTEPRTASVPIIFITASLDERVLCARKTLGAVVLEKPFHTAELLLAVEKALAREAREGLS